MKIRNQPPYEVLGTKWLSYDEIILLKGVEELVELYYNSGQYTLTLKYPIHFHLYVLLKTPEEYYTENREKNFFKKMCRQEFMIQRGHPTKVISKYLKLI